MGESMKRFLQGLPICVVFPLAAAVATLVFHAASDYITHLTVLKYYSVGWFAASLLCFYCGLLVVPRSPGIFFAFAGLIAFAVLCGLDPGAFSKNPIASSIIQMLPAVLFLLAWAFVTLSTSRSENKKIRWSTWLWLTIFLTLTASWASFHYAEHQLLNLRNLHITEARSKTLLLAEHLEDYKETNGKYPDTLAETGWPEEMWKLSYRNKTIKYFGHGSDYVLTFEDPMVYKQQAYSYDTSKDHWFPDDPQEALKDYTYNVFMGYLRKL